MSFFKPQAQMQQWQQMAMLQSMTPRPASTPIQANRARDIASEAALTPTSWTQALRSQFQTAVGANMLGGGAKLGAMS